MVGIVLLVTDAETKRGARVPQCDKCNPTVAIASYLVAD